MKLQLTKNKKTSSFIFCNLMIYFLLINQTLAKQMCFPDIELCENSKNKTVNSNMIMEEGDRIDFIPNFVNLEDGQFQFAFKLLSPEELGDYPIFKNLGKGENFTKGLLIAAKIVYLTDKKPDHYFSQKFHLSPHFINHSLHHTEVDAIIPEAPSSVKIKKVVKINLGFHTLKRYMKMYVNIRTLRPDSGKFMGDFNAFENNLFSTYKKDVIKKEELEIIHHMVNQENNTEIAKELMVSHLLEADQFLHQGTSLMAYYPYTDQSEGKERNLIVSYQLMALNQNSFVKKIMKSFPHLAEKSTRREISLYIDHIRDMNIDFILQ